MAPDRASILAALEACLRGDERVAAAWLEGADATGWVDDYSDIDFCCSAPPEALESISQQAQAALERLAPLDLVHLLENRPEYRHTVFHLAGTSEYLLIDFVAYPLGRGSQYTAGDEIEKPRVLFDRGGVIHFNAPDPVRTARDNARRLQQQRDMVAQYSRLVKYFRRGDFLEAFGYYHKWLLQPLIEVLRLRYTPLHPDYYIVHISRHLPPEVLHRLEALFQVQSVEEMEAKSRAALQFFEETASGVALSFKD